VKTKEKVYDRIVEYLHIEGYPTEVNTDFKEANTNNLVYATTSCSPIPDSRVPGTSGEALSGFSAVECSFRPRRYKAHHYHSIPSQCGRTRRENKLTLDVVLRYMVNVNQDDWASKLRVVNRQPRTRLRMRWSVGRNYGWISPEASQKLHRKQPLRTWRVDTPLHSRLIVAKCPGLSYCCQAGLACFADGTCGDSDQVTCCSV
jgi:hypothetical protein